MNGTEIKMELTATFHVAPINSHHVLQHVTNILKEMSELERIDCNNGEIITTNLSVKYIPVGLKEKES